MALLGIRCYRPPRKWKEVFGNDDEFDELGTRRGDLNKPPHGTTAGFAFQFDDSPVLVAKLLAQIAGFNFDNPKHQAARLSIFQNLDPGAGARFKIWRAEMQAKNRAEILRQPAVPKKMLREIKSLHPKDWREIVAGIENRSAIRNAKLVAENPQPISEEDLRAAERHHAEWHEIEKAMNSTPGMNLPTKMLPLGIIAAPPPHLSSKTKPKGEISKAAHDEIKAREKILKNWPSVSDFVPPELLSTSIEGEKYSATKRKAVRDVLARAIHRIENKNCVAITRKGQ